METLAGLHPIVVAAIYFVLMISAVIAYNFTMRRLAFKHLAAIVHNQRNFAKACSSDFESVKTLQSAELKQFREGYGDHHPLGKELLDIKRTTIGYELELMKIAIINAHIYHAGIHLNLEERRILAKSMSKWNVAMQQLYLNRLLAPFEDSATLKISILPPANWIQKQSIWFRQAMMDLQVLPNLRFSNQALPKEEKAVLG
jgi:hypothetical protein